MPSSADAIFAKRFTSAFLRRLLLCICSLVLVSQLVGAAFHKHDATEQLPDCVACQLASQPLADIPAVPPSLLAVFLLVAYVLARQPRPPAVVLRRYLIPSRQAPPAPRCAIR
ncbi:hypothetical protein [Massilia consociata]|uniref:DUF2946 domain-containing protein n=1 Tax=Massilia consociata TaxID=760117 RepID=A0ABV6FGT2_9BURK